jgi:hypothetical protein
MIADGRKPRGSRHVQCDTQLKATQCFGVFPPSLSCSCTEYSSTVRSTSKSHNSMGSTLPLDWTELCVNSIKSTCTAILNTTIFAFLSSLSVYIYSSIQWNSVRRRWFDMQTTSRYSMHNLRLVCERELDGFQLMTKLSMTYVSWNFHTIINIFRNHTGSVHFVVLFMFQIVD